jgi:hypothetical protein
MIRNPELFARACEWVGSLITYSNGTPRSTDLDSISQCGEKFVITEAKKLVGNELFVPYGQFKTLSELHRQLKKPHFFITGTQSYNLHKPDDLMYYIDFKKLLSGKIQYSRLGYGGIILNAKDMNISTRKLFSAVCNDILK